LLLFAVRIIQASIMAGEDSFDMEEEEGMRAFWAIELVPNKEYSTSLPFDLHITSAVLPASAKDNGRGVVSVSFADEKDKNFSIVSLKLDTHDSQSLDVVLDEGSEVTFTVSGKNSVHLSGYYVAENTDDGLYDDDDIDSDEVGDDDELEGGSDSDDVDEGVDAATMAKVQSLIEDKKRKAQQNGAESNKKAKAEPQQPKKESKPTPSKATPSKATPSKPQQQEGKKPQQQQQQQQKPQQKVVQLPNGLAYKVTQEGTGPVATKGKRVGVKYVGKLTKNNKVFDASQNKPIVFTLGAREVITGWDMGIAGMKVGEKRTLIIPSDLGYGAKGAGREIPPNSSLTFDVELVHVK